MTARLVRLLEMRGRDVRAVCASCGASVDELTDPSARIPHAVSDALIEASARALGEGTLAIEMAKVFDEATYDAAGLVLLSSATFGEGLTRAFAYQRLWADGERFTLLRTHGADGESRGTVRFRHPGPSPLARAVLAELAFIETMNAARALVDPNARPIAIRLRHEPLAPPDALTATFGIAPTFGQTENELVLDARLLDAPVRVPEGAIAQVFDRIAQRAIAALPPTVTLAVRLRAICADASGSFTLGVADVARRVHMSPRTLQRRLRAEGTSWAEILDDVRRTRARELASAGASDKEIAILLGFSDPSALVRARRRWSRASGQ